MRRAGSRLRVTAQLIKVADGYHLWSERYDREMADIFDIQDEIVESITKAIAPTLVGQAKQAVRRPTDNLEAYEQYLKGRHFWHQRSPATVQHAIRCFEQVIALDPDYALAYSGMADCHAIFRVYGWVSGEQLRPRALEAVTRAMALDPTLAEVQCSQALYVFYFSTAWRSAIAHLHKALAINPRMSMAQAYLGLCLACENRDDEAVAAAGMAQEIDPHSSFIHYLAAVTLVSSRAFPLAERAARRSLELQPDSLTGLWTLGLALSGQERHDEAISVIERAVMLSRAPVFVGQLGLVYSRAGRVDDARRLLSELDDRQQRGEYVAPFARLPIHVGLNDTPGIRGSLEACVADGSPPFSIKAFADPFMERNQADPVIARLRDRIFEGARPTRS